MNNSALHPTSVLRLLSAGRFKMAKEVASPFLTSSVWVLEIIIAGRLEIQVENDEWQTLETGVLYAPGTRYREKVAARGDFCRSIALFFELHSPPQIMAWERFDARYLIIRDEEKLLAPLAEEILHHLGLSTADELLATSCFFELISHLLRAQVQGKTLIVMREYEGGDLVARAHRLMRARLQQPLKVAEIADEVGLSVSGFAHAYKRQTGISPMTALRQMRVETAKSHLLRDRLSLSQIADETGFADAFHLSRAFKQNVGVSPRQFRRRLIQRKGAGHENPIS